jgi:hypothetical protein
VTDDGEYPGTSGSARRAFLKAGGATIGLAALGAAPEAKAATAGATIGPHPVPAGGAAAHVKRQMLHGAGTFAKGLEMPAEAWDFARRQSGRIRSEPVTAAHRKAASAWLRKLRATEEEPAKIVDAVVARAVRVPNAWTLLVTQAALNELGRTPRIAALIGERVTPELMHEVALASQRRPADRTERN